jgi:uncharacterized RDD family membrane protein YckC
MATTLSAPVTAPPASAVPAPQPEDRTQLDSRRVIARAIDGVFAGAPFLIPVLGLPLRLSIVLVSIGLVYFFVCEALWGQTIGKRIIGLRVLMRDGRPATASAVAARTILRLLDDGPIGLGVYLLSGQRRQRLGDLAGDTIVARPTPGLPHASFSPLLLVYPVLLAAATAALALAFSGTEARGDYVRAVDRACAQRIKVNAASRPKNLDAIVARKRADHRALAAVKAPKSARTVRAEILALDAKIDTALATAAARAKASRDPAKTLEGEVKHIAAARQTAAKRFSDLGLRACSGA